MKINKVVGIIIPSFIKAYVPLYVSVGNFVVNGWKSANKVLKSKIRNRSFHLSIISTTTMQRKLLASLLLIAITASFASYCGVRVYGRRETIYGKTYEEWAIKWWKLVINSPQDQNPLNDQTGELCYVGKVSPKGM